MNANRQRSIFGLNKEGRVDWHTELKVSSLAKGDGCRILDTVTLNSGRVLKGRVLNQDGAPVDQATVVVMGRDWQQ